MEQAAEQKHGIKETKEAIVGINELAIAVISVIKDGVQPVQDFSALFAKYQSDPALKAKIDGAIANIQAVPAELAELSLTETAELVGLQVTYVPKIVEALK